MYAVKATKRGIVGNNKIVCIVRETMPFPFWGLNCEGVEQIRLFFET
jgi:hypothetical protein